jgi:diguanylate cyclase (GGDEF)-like protein
MPRRLLESLTALFIPGGLIVSTAYFLAWRPSLIPGTLVPLLHVLPVVVFVAGLLLAWFFHRSRMTFAILLVGATYLALWSFTDSSAAVRNADRLVLFTLAVLLPVNLAAILIIKERGVLTPKGLWVVGSVILQALAIFMVAHSGSVAVEEGLAQTWIDKRWIGWTGLPQSAVLAFGTAIGFVLIRLSVARRPVEHGFLWTLVALFLALHTHPLRDSQLYFIAAGLVLGVSLIQTSYAMAYHDELTGLAGRRALNETLLRLGSDYAIAMIDVDHFKRFNDTYGHEVGDQVLRMVASKIAHVAGGGQAFRYGGEEFAIVFPGTCLAKAVSHLHALRATIEHARFAVRGRWRPRNKPTTKAAACLPRKEVSVTISIGVAEPSGHRVDPAQVVIAADRALYRAKKAGRNQVKC